jgi:molecular chaperone DnaK (HSP70)
MECVDCQHCGWPVSSNDVYCGGCGEKINRIRVFAANEPNAEIFGNFIQVNRYLDNRNLLSVSFQNIGLHTRMLIVKNPRGISADPLTVVLPPMIQSADTTVALGFEKDHQSPANIEWVTDQEDTTIRLSVNWKPVPVITYEGSDLIFGSFSDTSLSHSATFVIHHSDVTVRDVQIDPPWIQPNQVQREWKKNTPLTLQLTADPKTAEESDVDLSEITVSFIVLERDKPIVRKIPARLSRISKPQVISDNPIYVDYSQILIFTFRLLPKGKAHDEPALIEDLHIQISSNDTLPRELAYKWCGHSGIGDPVSTNSPVYTLEIDTSELPSDSRHTMELHIYTNHSPEVPTKHPVVLIVKREKVFTGILALDFGTSYSMGAFKRDGGDPEYLSLDTVNTVIKEVPSKIAYRTFDDRVIGYNAENLPLHDRTFNQSRLLDSVKRFIGDSSRRFDLAIGGDHKRLSPREVMRDYCAEMLSIFEHQEGRFKGSLTLTYPSKFSWLQTEEVRWVAQSLGIPKDKSYFLDEARAVMNYAINAQDIDIISGSCFMVMDIGGGTTDIAICGKTDEPHPEIIDIAGDRDFGGENITDWIAELMVRQAELEIKPWKVLFGDKIPKIFQNDPAASDKIAECRFNLLKSAFQIKKDWPVTKISLPPLYIFDDSFEIIKTEAKEIDFTDWMNIEDMTRDAIQNILNEVNLILEEKGITLSLIILAGQGGLFAPIRSMISEITKTDIVQCQDLKGAVSHGAIAYTDYVLQGGKIVKNQHLTRSALGIRLPLKNKPVTQFTKFIPRNASIPTQFLGHWFNWNNRDFVSFQIFERWGPESSYKTNRKFEDYIATDEVVIPSELTQILDRKRCYLLLRMLTDETVSLCKFFLINDGETDTLTILKSELQKHEVNGTVIYHDASVPDIELFHSQVYSDLSGQPVFLMESTFGGRPGE